MAHFAQISCPFYQVPRLENPAEMKAEIKGNLVKPADMEHDMTELDMDLKMY